MRKKVKFITYTSLTILGLAILGDFCQKQTKGFRLQNVISSSKEISPDWIQPLSFEEKKQIELALDQPFYFLKKGQQCFTFLSADKNYVLKLFRWEKLEPPFWTQLLPSSLIASIKKERQEKKHLDFTSYQIAYEELKEETGLIYLQLGRDSSLQVPLKIYDNLQIKHTLQTNQTGFILQKKANDFLPYFEEKRKNHEEKDLETFFLSLKNLLHSRSQKGIYDSDISLEHNMGILDGKPLLFDIGNLKKEEASMQKQSRLMLCFLEKNAPSLAIFLEKALEEN